MLNRCQAECCTEHAYSGTAEAQRRKTKLTETYGRAGGTSIHLGEGFFLPYGLACHLERR